MVVTRSDGFWRSKLYLRKFNFCSHTCVFVMRNLEDRLIGQLKQIVSQSMCYCAQKLLASLKKGAYVK